jgi:phosphoglycolate phosphatase-like HAD superfamily hydrolase
LLKLIAFDCDGVLFDSREANIAFYNAILEQFGMPRLSPAATDFVHSHNIWEYNDRLRELPSLKTISESS